jgi:hypothetical protein
VPDLTGGTEGVGRITVTTSLAGRPTYYLSARPHPGRVSSFGYPSATGYTAYQAHIRWRVNSFTVLGSYTSNSGGYFYPAIVRVNEVNSEQYYCFPEGANTYPNRNEMLYFATATPGVMYDSTLYMAFGGRDVDSFRAFDYAQLNFRFNNSDNTTQVDIDRFIVTNLGALNAPSGYGPLVNTPTALVMLSTDQFISPITAGVGSVGFRVGNLSQWRIGVSAFVSKPAGAAKSWIYAQSSYSLTLAGTTSMVQTLTMVDSAEVRGVIRRANSWNYIVSGAGIS